MPLINQIALFIAGSCFGVGMTVFVYSLRDRITGAVDPSATRTIPELRNRSTGS